MTPIEPLLYFGSAEIAVPTLEALAAHHRVCAVCTQPDRPSGRKQRLTPSPVKRKAMELGLPIIDPAKIGEARDRLRALAPALAIVFAYGQYLPPSIFNLPTLGSINLHPSLLPRYRGASPIQSALADGLVRSGLSILRVSERMDAGDLLLQEPLDIHPEDTCASLSERFAARAATLILEALELLQQNRATWSPQEEALATECRKLSKSDGEVDWFRPARCIANAVRAYYPWPGVFFQLPGTGPVKILRSRVVAGDAPPGLLLPPTEEGPVVATGQEALCLLEVQPPGKTPMSGHDFLNGHPLPPGCRLPSP